ncbi:MAG: S8 family serine peptidase [Chloroflexi bacterium]|nr:S8 family serine peptidase [Chloroflexota bacterium]
MRNLLAGINWKSAALLLAAVSALLALMMWMPASSDRAHAQTPDGDGLIFENMDEWLNELARQHANGEFISSTFSGNGITSDGGSVGVIFHTESGTSEGVRDFLLQNGASPGPAFDEFVGANVPVSLLAEASRQDGVNWMQTDFPPRALDDDSDGGEAIRHGVDVWHAAGLKGAGVKIAVIHFGFEGIQDLMGTELPQTVTARCYTGYGAYETAIEHCEKGQAGGTTRLQRIFDVAPDATYYIITITDRVDLYDAAHWMGEEGIDIVNNSIIWIYSGPGDGTSPYFLSELSSVDIAIEGGVTWVMPAGNDAQATWFGAFRDDDDDGYHEFDDGNECNGVEARQPGGWAYVGVIRWEGKWTGPVDPLTNRDLQLQMVDEETSTLLRRSHRSFRVINAPIEYLYFFPAPDRNYCLRVKLVEGTAPNWIQVQSFFGQELEQPSLSGGIVSPAESNNPGMISVGAASPDNPDEIWERSSRGPAPEPWPRGRIKPELVAGLRFDATQPLSMRGTGWAAAYVAGIAALVKQRFPEYSPEEVADYLKSNAEDKGEPGPDNTWGYGQATLPASDAAAPLDPDACIQRIYGSHTIEASWDDNCLSENRPDGDEGTGEGDYYARFYTLAVGAGKRLTIDLTSDHDAYLYLMRGEGREGSIAASNDDSVPYIDFNSRIVIDGLRAGEYTIEATTYEPEKSGAFTLVVQIDDTDTEPEPAPAPSGPFTEFSRGTDHACALRSDGRIACWGDDEHGQASPPAGRFSAVSGGENGSCALRDDGAAICWGIFEVSPSFDDTASGPFTEVSRGADHACALGAAGAITCWGANSHGQASPPDGEFSAIHSSIGGSCALRSDNALVCWGSFDVRP